MQKQASAKTYIEMKGMSRRKFLQVAGATMLAAALPAIGRGRNRRGPEKYRIRPLASPADLCPGEIAFCRRARFATAADAMRAAAAHRMAAEIYIE